MSDIEEFDGLEDHQDDAETDLKYYAKRKLVVNWNNEDGEALEHIKELAQSVYLDIFGATLALLDELYEKTNNGDNWGLLVTKDLEGYLLKLSNQKISTTLQLNAKKMEAIFAKYSLEDDYHQAYLEGSGTNALREAKAHTETIEKRYSYFLRFYIWTLCEGLGREIDGLTKNLNSVLYRRGNNA